MPATEDCLACDLAEGRRPLPGGLIYATEHWRVEHCTGPLGIGTLIVKPKRHVLRVADLEPGEYREMGPLLHRTASVVQKLTDPLQVYVCLWSHGPVHIHFVVQLIDSATTDEFAARGPSLQSAMFARRAAIDYDAAVRFAALAREWFAGNRG